MLIEACVQGERITARPFVDGSWVEEERRADGRHVVDFDPSTGKALAILPVPSESLADRAMASAHAAWRDWRRRPRRQRAALLERLANVIEASRQRLVAIIRAETGILLDRASDEVTHGVELLLETARHSDSQDREVSQGHFPSASVADAPFGVVVWIKSWNSPIAALCKIGAPLLAGNTVVLKVSGRAPLCGCAFAEAVQEAGFPAGVVNVLWDERGELAGRLVRHPLLGKCAVTGSLETGRSVLAGIAERGIRPTFMETGGGGIQVIFEDADLDRILPHVFWGAFTLAGQICCAGTRILVQRRLFNRVLEELAGMTESLRVGSAHEPETQLGPVISAADAARLAGLIERTRQSGGRLLTGRIPAPETGFFVSPAVIETEGIDTPPFREEIFGPLAVVAPFDAREQVACMLETMGSGLALALYTSRPDRVTSMLDDLHAGTVWVNGYYQSTVRVPFGGMKDSGYGREKGDAGLREFAQPRVVVGARG